MFSRLRYVGIGTAALVFGFSALPVSAGQFSVVDLGVLGTSADSSGISQATGINDAGQVVGWSDASGNSRHAFLYQGGVMHDLGATIGADPSGAAAINASGQVVGWTGGAAPYPEYAASFKGGIQVLGSLGGYGTSQALGINDSGVIVGVANQETGYGRAFRYQGGTMQDLGTLGGNSPGQGNAAPGQGNAAAAYAINAGGQIVGVSTASVPSGAFAVHAFLYQHGAMTDLGTLDKNGTESAAKAINSSGQIVGVSEFNASTGVTHAFLYDHGNMHDLGGLNGNPNSNTGATGINDQGQIVGFANNSVFLFDQGHMYDLNDLIPHDSGWQLDAVTGINNLGQIVGYGQNAQGETHAFLLTPTDLSSSPTAPEPGTLALLSLGSISLAGYGWRCRQRAIV